MKIFAFLVWSMTLFATPYDSYFDGAAKTFGVEVSLLKRIATIESSMNAKAINVNANKTNDIGLMQINSIHLKRLSKIGITQQALMDPEVNIYVGAMLLSSHIKRQGYNLEAIGCYHSGNPVYKNQWLKRLAMTSVPLKNATADVTMPTLKESDPRTRFAQEQLSRRTDEKIAQGLDSKKAWREARLEVDHLMGYTTNQ